MKILNAFANISIIALLVCQGCVLTLAEESSAKILENERVVVWRIGADTNSLAPARQPRFPAVLISLVDGAVRFIDATDSSTIRPESGQAVDYESGDKRLRKGRAIPSNRAAIFTVSPSTSPSSTG